MKFSSSLKFNAVSEWWEEYIAYDALKKYIYQLEKRQAGLDGGLESSYHDLETNERQSLLNDPSSTSTDAVFIPLLDKELKKITLFYESQEKDLLDDVDTLEEQVRLQEEAGVLGAGYEGYTDDEQESDDDDDDDESLSHSREATGQPVRRRRTLSGSGYGRLSLSRDLGTSRSPARRRASISSSGDDDAQPGPLHRFANRLRDSVATLPDTVWTSKSNAAYDTRLLFKRRITNLYITVSSLKAYVEVNYSGFRKILKKYDKVTYSELKDQYLHTVVESVPPFTQPSKQQLNSLLVRLTDLYAKCVMRGDLSLAKKQLKLNQRENIAWERDTVWRQMIGRERRGEGKSGLPSAIGGTIASDDEEEAGALAVPTPVGKFRVSRRKIMLLLSIALFVILLNVETIKSQDGSGTEARCLAILTFCTVLWATEAIPLFVTSLMVPLLLVVLQSIKAQNGTAMTPKDATKFVFSGMFSPTIMLLIGGFTISSALSKSNIDRILITRVLSLAGSRPSTVLLAFMGVSCFASMLISNVAAPTLCFTLIRPILRTLPPKSKFAPALILGIALAANVGGQSSPISSPQNLIALAAMDPPLDWGNWFIVSIPVSLISIVLIWGLLVASYNPAQMPDGEGELEIKPIRPTREPFTLKQYWVSFVCVVTIGLWCVAHNLEGVFGDMGVIAIIPILAFFATGVLKKDDFEQFAWTIIFLAMGGIALGKGVDASGLLQVLDMQVRKLVAGVSLYNVVLILSPVVLVISTFISHTIASVLLVPIAAEVGQSLGGQHKNLLIFITGLICSAGMGMPVSGFPNQTAATQEDDLGQLYLSNIDFLKNGVPASIIATLVVSTIGYLLMRVIGL